MPSNPPPGLLQAERPHLVLALHEVLVAYARLCDERDWGALDRVFAPGAQAVYGGHLRPDMASIARMLQRHLGGCG